MHTSEELADGDNQAAQSDESAPLDGGIKPPTTQEMQEQSVRFLNALLAGDREAWLGEVLPSMRNPFIEEVRRTEAELALYAKAHPADGPWELQFPLDVSHIALEDDLPMVAVGFYMTQHSDVGRFRMQIVRQASGDTWVGGYLTRPPLDSTAITLINAFEKGDTDTLRKLAHPGLLSQLPSDEEIKALSPAVGELLAGGSDWEIFDIMDPAPAEVFGETQRVSGANYRRPGSRGYIRVEVMHDDSGGMQVLSFSTNPFGQRQQ